MNRSVLFFSLFGALLLAFAAGRASGTTSSQAAQDEGQAEVAEAVAKVGALGEQHARLEALIGPWKAKVSAWPDTSAPPVEFDATIENTWVLERHFLRQEYHGLIDGQGFEGLGFLGYSNLEGIYQSIWMDSRNTAIQYTRLTASEDGKTWKGKGTETDPVSGTKRPFQDVIQVVSEKEYTFSRSFRDAEGKETQGFRVSYTKE